jgi:hypothetical protein
MLPKQWKMLCPAKNLEFLEGGVKRLEVKMVAAIALTSN